MVLKKYFPLLLGTLGTMIYVVYRNIAEIELCPNVTQLNDGSLFCESTVGFSDYLWPLWHFSRALIVVGIFVLIRPALFNRLVIWTGIAALATIVGVLAAPSIDSDFLLPIEKKGIGAMLSACYLTVSSGIFLWDLLKQPKSKK